MPVIPEISVLWPYSPRIVLVAAPVIEVTAQDVVDSLREIEEELIDLDKPFILNAEGKAFLSVVKLVGITATLVNAQLAFEPRTTPITTGTATSADPTGRLWVDTGADYVADGIKRGDTLRNVSDQSSATVLTVIDLNTLEIYPLSGGINNDVEVGDAYRVYARVAGKVSAGNLVATDINGDPLPAILDMPFVSAFVEADVSAALLNPNFNPSGIR